jgi:hypothetical protein
MFQILLHFVYLHGTNRFHLFRDVQVQVFLKKFSNLKCFFIYLNECNLPIIFF